MTTPSCARSKGGEGCGATTVSPGPGLKSLAGAPCSAHALGARSHGEDGERPQRRQVLACDQRSEAGRHEQRGEAVVTVRAMAADEQVEAARRRGPSPRARREDQAGEGRAPGGRAPEDPRRSTGGAGVVPGRRRGTGPRRLQRRLAPPPDRPLTTERPEGRPLTGESPPGLSRVGLPRAACVAPPFAARPHRSGDPDGVKGLPEPRGRHHTCAAQV